jgi:prophage regulatory protein
MPKRLENEAGRTAYTTDIALAAHFGVNRATIWGWVRKNDFPPPVRLSPQMSRWKWADVQQWVDARQKRK